MRPTVVLVHGAFAESSSWDRVIDPLLDAGHPVIADWSVGPNGAFRRAAS